MMNQMNFQDYLDNKKRIQNAILEFIDTENDTEEFFQNLVNEFEKQKIYDDPIELKSTLQLIFKISKEHYRTPNFFRKIEQILLRLKSSITRYFTQYAIFNIFRNSKRVLLFLIDENIITIDQNIANTIAHSSYKSGKYLHYFYPEIEKFLKDDLRDEIYAQIMKLDNDDSKNFDEKRNIGENDSYICRLIREDSIDQFISYINQKSIFVSAKIDESIYETNSYLLKKVPELIEYSAFCGSTQIFKYLFLNGAGSSSVWPYAIHGRNPEIINFLEENLPLPKNELFIDCFVESIKCHHSEMTEYVLRKYGEDNDCQSLNETLKSIKYYNYSYFPTNIENSQAFFDLCKYNHSRLADIVLRKSKFDEEIQINEILKIATENDNREIIQIIMRNLGIKSNSFFGCSSLRELKIPSSVRSISDNAFNCCFSLTQISIPFSVTVIEKEAFYKCSSLEQLTIPSSVTEIGERAFYGCSSLKRISISTSLRVIKKETFYQCSSLKQIFIPSSVNVIECAAFKGCSSLEHIVIPSSVTEIGDDVFYWCSSLVDVKIPSSVKRIGKAAFSVCNSIEEIELPPSINSIKEYCFSFCSSLKKIVIPYSVISIDDCAFMGCSSLESASIPSSVISIGEEAFFGCSALENISIPTSVTEIAKDAFKGCSLLSTIAVPSSVTYIGINAFPNLAKIIQV